MKHYNIPVFIPHLGCPHDCIFCNQKKITGLEESMSIESLRRYIESYLDEIYQNKNEKYVEVAFFGGSFTAIDPALQENYLKVAFEFKSEGKIDGIRLSTRPDYITDKILSRLKKYSVDTIELGVQSLDNSVLNLSQRGYEKDIVYKSSELIKKNDFILGLQMMIGLPGDTKQKSLLTANEIIKMQPNFVRIYPTLVIKDTPLELLHQEGLYQALSLKDAVEWTKALTYKFNRDKITIIRVGLQDSEGLLDHCVAGPYHPSFKQLVLSEMILDTLKEVMKNYTEIDSFSIEANIKNISEIVGQKRYNLKYLEQKYNLKKIKVYPVEMSMDEMVLHINKDRLVKEKYLHSNDEN